MAKIPGADYPQLEYPFGKKIQVVFDPNPMQDRVYLDDESVLGLRAVNVDSDMGERSVVFTVVHLPSAQEIRVEGYVVNAEQFNLLWPYGPNLSPDHERVPPVEGEGIVGYFVEDSDMRRIRDAVDNMAPEDREKLSWNSLHHNVGSV